MRCEIYNTHYINMLNDLVETLENVKSKVKSLPNSEFARHLLDSAILVMNDDLRKLISH